MHRPPACISTGRAGPPSARASRWSRRTRRNWRPTSTCCPCSIRPPAARPCGGEFRTWRRPTLERPNGTTDGGVARARAVKLLVTGAAGFIGFHTALRLLQRGEEVVGLDDLNAYYDPGLKAARLAILEREANFRFVKLDVANRAAMQALFDREAF